VQVVHHLVPGQDKDGATLVRWLKRVPTDFATVQWTSSQPSASHANRSSSLENSPFRGGRARYRSRSSAAGRALMKRRSRRRSSGDKQSTRGKISSALRCFGIRPILPDGRAVERGLSDGLAPSGRGAVWNFQLPSPSNRLWQKRGSVEVPVSRPIPPRIFPNSSSVTMPLVANTKRKTAQESVG
jgi:hypothetical protein